ncbi:bacterioferritin [Poseidonocella sedimentorum]|uniref:Bacterioferritin n=1 Tax=Poseidonocella sedimentorum TaxID=871652 RepID=A0A1I6DLS1_9RHOB|nr:bacterioferritin [Poseidonocella sedimentorum]SFR06308.1 bacterioferritin [Poseidonocella sedimentorum]
MTDTDKTLANLQTAVSMELAAVTQYLLHILTTEDWGLDKLAEKMRAEMLEELGHAEDYARRMIFLGGTPEMKPAKTPTPAQSLQDMFEADLADEKDAIRFYSQAAREADEANDIGTRVIFERTAMDEEGHMAWLDLQLSLMRRMGEPAFTAMQIGPPAAE